MEIMEENSKMIWKIWKKRKLDSDKIWKIWEKIVKLYGKYGRKLRNDMEIMDERQVE